MNIEEKLVEGFRVKKGWITLLLFAITCVIAWLALSSAMSDSATRDEPAHIAAGYLRLTHGWFDFYRPQPPLTNTLSALPLVISGRYHFPAEWKRDIGNQWKLGKMFLYRSDNDADEMVAVARIPTIFLFVLLCFVVYFWIFDATGNRWPALAGFILTGFCPNLTAHGRLATSDIGVTFFISLSSFLFYRFLYRPSRLNALLAGVSLGGAFLAKVSALILIPYFGIISVLFFLFEVLAKVRKKRDCRAPLAMTNGVFPVIARSGATWQSHGQRFLQEPLFMKDNLTGRYASGFLIIMAAAFVTLEAFYLFELQSGYISYAYPESADSVLRRLTIPFREYARHVSAVYKWSADPYLDPQFLLGSFSSTGWWYYYIVAFALKTPAAALILFFAALCFYAVLLPRSIAAANAAAGFSLRSKSFFYLSGALIFVLLFFAVSARSNLNIGIRYIIPVYPFIFFFIPVSFYLAGCLVKKKQRLLSAVLVVGVFGHAAASATSYPHYLGFFNSFIGSDENADKYLIDSNIDWGQDLKRLAVFVEKNRIPAIRVIYFGGGDVEYYLGQRAIEGREMRFFMEFLSGYPGYYAISRHLYRCSELFLNGGKDFDLSALNIKSRIPVGKSLVVYKVE